MPKTVRHVWVQSPEHHTPPDPGVLVEWRRAGSRWEAWVITVVDRPGRSPAVLERWYDERDVMPAPTKPRSPDRARWHLGWYGEASKTKWQ